MTVNNGCIDARALGVVATNSCGISCEYFTNNSGVVKAGSEAVSTIAAPGGGTQDQNFGIIAYQSATFSGGVTMAYIKEFSQTTKNYSKAGTVYVSGNGFTMATEMQSKYWKGSLKTIGGTEYYDDVFEDGRAYIDYAGHTTDAAIGTVSIYNRYFKNKNDKPAANVVIAKDISKSFESTGALDGTYYAATSAGDLVTRDSINALSGSYVKNISETGASAVNTEQINSSTDATLVAECAGNVAALQSSSGADLDLNMAGSCGMHIITNGVSAGGSMRIGNASVISTRQIAAKEGELLLNNNSRVIAVESVSGNAVTQTASWGSAANQALTLNQGASLTAISKGENGVEATNFNHNGGEFTAVGSQNAVKATAKGSGSGNIKVKEGFMVSGATGATDNDYTLIPAHCVEGETCFKTAEGREIVKAANSAGVSSVGFTGAAATPASATIKIGVTQTFAYLWKIFDIGIYLNVSSAYTADGTKKELVLLPAAIDWNGRKFHCVVEDNAFRQRITNDCALTVEQWYKITTSATGYGIVSPTNLEVKAGGSCVFEFEAGHKSKLGDVKVNGSSVMSAVKNNKYTLTNVQSDCVLEAFFTHGKSDVDSLVDGGNGRVSPEGLNVYDRGTKQIYTFTPESGYKLKDVTLDGVSVINEVVGNQYELLAEKELTILIATFEKIVLPQPVVADVSREINTNESCSFALTASGGTEPYAWSIALGSLPQGMALSADGTVSGVPATAGTFELAVKVTDANAQTAEGKLTLIVKNPAPAPEPTSEPTPTPAPAPKPVDLSNMKIIENGKNEFVKELKSLNPELSKPKVLYTANTTLVIRLNKLETPQITLSDKEYLQTLQNDGIDSIQLKHTRFNAAYTVENLIKSEETTTGMQVGKTESDINGSATVFKCEGENWCVGLTPSDVPVKEFVFRASSKRRYFCVRNGVEEPIELFVGADGKVYGRVLSPKVGGVNEIIVK